MSFWEAYPKIESALEEVRRVMGHEAAALPSPLRGHLEEYLSRDSKLLRPGFVILSTRIQSRSERRLRDSVRLAAAVELLHVATLIHDDIVDEAETRRGSPSAHVSYGVRRAVLLGDYLFARCFNLVSEHAQPFAARMLATFVSHVVGGEVAEFASGGKLLLSVRDYTRRITAKTAALFGASFYLGTAKRNFASASARSIRRVGYNLGMAFQIRDDILDLTGDSGRMGKGTNEDITNGVYTLPFILAARQQAGAPERGPVRDDVVVRSAIARAVMSGDCDPQTLREMVLDAGGVELANRYAQRYTDHIEAELRRLPAGEDRDILLDVTRRLTQRVA